MKNNYKIIGDVIELEMKNGERCLIDLEDLNKVDKAISDNQFWYVASDGYIRGGNPVISLHRLVMDTPKGLVVDHLNHLKWDNRKSNLRNCTVNENAKNKLTHKELIELGVKKVKSFIKEEPKEEFKLLNNQEVMELLNVKRQTLHVYREKKNLPYIKINARTFRYKENEVLEWIEKQNK